MTSKNILLSAAAIACAIALAFFAATFINSSATLDPDTQKIIGEQEAEYLILYNYGADINNTLKDVCNLTAEITEIIPGNCLILAFGGNTTPDDSLSDSVIWSAESIKMPNNSDVAIYHNNTLIQTMKMGQLKPSSLLWSLYKPTFNFNTLSDALEHNAIAEYIDIELASSSVEEYAESSTRNIVLLSSPRGYCGENTFLRHIDAMARRYTSDESETFVMLPEEMPRNELAALEKNLGLERITLVPTPAPLRKQIIDLHLRNMAIHVPVVIRDEGNQNLDAQYVVDYCSTFF